MQIFGGRCVEYALALKYTVLIYGVREQRPLDFTGKLEIIQDL